MSPRFYRYNLLLDEGLYPRKSLSRVNSRHNVKHIKHDLNSAGIKDKEVYKIAIEQKRIIVTYNTRHFKKLATLNENTGVIGVGQGITPEQLDVKLNSLLSRSLKKSFYGKYTPLSKAKK